MLNALSVTQQNARHRSYYGYPTIAPVCEPLSRALYFDSHWPLYSTAWSLSEYGHFIAVATYNEEANNRVHVLCAQDNGKGDGVLTGFNHVADALVTLPQTKVGWNPRGPIHGSLKLLSTGDCLRLWNLNMQTGKLEALCPLAKKSRAGQGRTAPLTSFDWNTVEPNLAITSSIDTTCTLWDLEAQSVRTQLIAHDSDVYDVGFLAQSANEFVSVSSDGSARLFDLRSLDNSTIIFETQPTMPLLRVAPNPFNNTILATIAADNSMIFIIDIRSPRNPAAVLDAHQAVVNSISWSPRRRDLLASGGDDCQLLVWSLSKQDMLQLDSNFTDSGQINSVLWSPDGAWLASVSGRTIQGVRY